MYWQFNSRQKQWISRLIKSGKPYVDVKEVLKESWPEGQLEISTFQQKLLVHLDDAESGMMDQVVNHILEICGLFNKLENEHLIRSWSELPHQDNTEYIGVKTEGAIPYFLPDMDVAAEMIKWYGKKIMIEDDLASLAKRNFRDLTTHNLVLNRRILIAGIAAFCLFIFIHGLYIKRDLNTRIMDIRNEIMLSRQQDKENLDRLNARYENLYLNHRMATDSQQEAALKVMGDAIDRSTYQLNKRALGLDERIKENQRMLKTSDSLLRKLSADL